jgi:hypothetical protein
MVPLTNVHHIVIFADQGNLTITLISAQSLMAADKSGMRR